MAAELATNRAVVIALFLPAAARAVSLLALAATNPPTQTTMLSPATMASAGFRNGAANISDAAYGSWVQSMTVMSNAVHSAADLAAANYTLDGDGFCADHQCHADPSGSLPACCEATCAAPADDTPHFLYLHVQKTGGSSIECALQEAAASGIVDLLGHVTGDIIAPCEARCTARGVPTARLLSVREPYNYWQSVYTYSWQCIYGACLSGESGHLLDDPAAGIRLHSSPGTPIEAEQGVLRSFGAFLAHVISPNCTYRTGLSQSGRIAKTCGEPCMFEELLRSETLTDDWAELLRRYPSLPQVELPYINESGEDYDQHPWGAPPEPVYTPELRALVQQVDGWVFRRFNYSV